MDGGAIVGLVLQRSTDLAGEPTRIRVRSWDTNDRALVELDGRQFLACKKREADWSLASSVRPITAEEWRAILNRPADRSKLPRITADTPEPSPDPADELAPPVPEPKRAVSRPVKEPKRPPRPKERNPCICGCGTLVESTLKRGHWIRLRQWAEDVTRGKITPDAIPEAARVYLRAKGLLA
jgi:hypothetical protein